MAKRADVLVAPSMSRLVANLPTFRAHDGLRERCAPWFETMASVPAYARVRADAAKRGAGQRDDSPLAGSHYLNALEGSSSRPSGFEHALGLRVCCLLSRLPAAW